MERQGQKMFNLFKKAQTPEEKMAKELAKAKQINDMKRRPLEQRQIKISECYAVLQECYNTFEKTIILENSRVLELRSQGFGFNEYRSRIREAAIGMLVAKEAMIKMRQISTDEEMVKAMNQMGMALKQVQRLDSSSKAISESTKRTLKKWYPYPLEESPSADSVYAQLSVPQEIRDRIDEKFISDLMQGIGFEACLLDSATRSVQISEKKSQLDADMEIIDRAFSDQDDAMKKSLEEKYSNPF